MKSKPAENRRHLDADHLAAARGATDFAGLFVSFSFFLILSAALLIALIGFVGTVALSKFLTRGDIIE